MSPTKLLKTSATLVSNLNKASSAPTCLRLHYMAKRQLHTRSPPTPPRLPTSTVSRPRLTPTSTRSSPLLRPSPGTHRTIFIQTESTPNADALKFLPNHRVLPEGVAVPFIEYLTPRATVAPPYPSPLAAQLMQTDGVAAVFYGADFITVTKAPDASWAHVRPEVFSLITEAMASGQPIVKVASPSQQGQVQGQQDGQQEQQQQTTPKDEAGAVEADSLAYDENDSEVVGMIKELLETRIRPAIQEDGGDIEFRGFVDGHVRLKLRGACRTCDSSTSTLKTGIEGMLMHYIEEVKGVQQVLDPEEEVSALEFSKFEEKLKQQRGDQATPTMDSAPG